MSVPPYHPQVVNHSSHFSRGLSRVTALTVGIAYALSVVVVNPSALAASVPGMDWVASVQAQMGGYRDVAYGNGIFVASFGNAIPTGPLVATSADGITWTPRGAGVLTENMNIAGVAFGDGIFAVVAENKLLTSPDGITWTDKGMFKSASGFFYGYPIGVDFANGQFFISRNSGTAIASADKGVTWRELSGMRGISFTYGEGRYVAMVQGDATNYAWSSANAITWETSGTDSSGVWSSVAYGGGIFVAVSRNLYRPVNVLRSVDGTSYSFTKHASGIQSEWSAITYGAGLFVAVSRNGEVMTSPDGITWTLRTNGVRDDVWKGVTYAAGMFVAVGENGSQYPKNYIMTSGSISTPGPLAFSSGAFGSAAAGSSIPLSAVVTNTGSAPATPTGVSVAGAGVAITGGTCAVSTPVAAGGTCTVNMTWTPTTAGSLTGAALTVSYPDGSSPSNSLTLTGTALGSQTVTWAPTSTVTVAASPLTPSTTASALGDASITYSITSAGTTGCAVNAASGVLTFTAAGSCTVRATAAATSAYAAGSKDVTFTVSLGVQSVTWSPVTTVTVPASPFTPSLLASGLGGAVITYSVNSAGTTGCAVNPSSGGLTFSAVGTCSVRATASATSAYAEGFKDVSFTISKAAAGLAWAPTIALTATSGSVTFATATATSSESISYAVTSVGTTGCSVVSATRTLTFTGSGSCEVTASIVAGSQYDAATVVQTFAIAKDTPSLSWSPISTVYAGASPIALAAATTNSLGAVTYAVATDSGAGCAISSSVSPTLTVATLGTCTVTALVAQTDLYAARTVSVAITVALSTPVVTWAPTTILVMPAATVNPASAATTSAGDISYSVTSDAGTGCLVNSVSGALSYAAVGQCQVTATSVATSRYASTSSTVTFTVVLASQTITGSASATTLAPTMNAVLSHSGTLGSGAITRTMTSPAGACSLSGTRVLAITDGTCVFTIAIAADAIYGGASTTVTINVNTPSSTSAPGAGTGGGSLPSDSPMTQDNQIPVPISPALAAASNSAESNTSLATTDVKRRQLPPPPSNISIRRIAISGKAKVAVDLPTGAAGDAVAATVVVVRDVTGRVVARISVEIARGQDAVVITVPFASAGYTVSVYNVNDVGVSTGALISSPVVQAKTISSRDVNDRPLLFGNQLGKPVIFNGGSAALDAVGRSELNRIAQQATRSNGRLFVTGFARKGGGSANQLDRLSSLRAQTVATYLSSRGVRVWIRYWGAGSSDGTGQPADRRVEVRQSADAVPRTFVS